MSPAPEWTPEAAEEYTDVLPSETIRRAVDSAIDRWAGGQIQAAPLPGGFGALSVPPFLVIVDPAPPPCVVKIKRFHW